MARPDPQAVLEVLQKLLGPGGCPWDREQTPESLCDYLIEEVFELVEAVRAGNSLEIQDEMGDAFFLLFFLASLLERRHGFGLDDVWRQSAEKMAGRHPHVFGQARFSNRRELLENWEEVKKREKGENDGSKAKDSPGPLASIPASLPPLIRSYRIQAKAAKLGFSWDSDADQERSLESEWREWLQAKNGGSSQEKEEEFGDLLFSLVEHGRRHGIKANAALHEANLKFLSRFQSMLQLAREKGLRWEELDLAGKDELWAEVKENEAAG